MNNNESLPGFTPDMEMVGSVELTEVQARLINRFASTILGGTLEQAEYTFNIIFDRPPVDEMEMRIFAALCQFSAAGNVLEGRRMSWDDIPPEFKPGPKH